MASTSHEYQVPLPAGTTPEIRIGTASGSVTIHAQERPGVTVLASHPAAHPPAVSPEGSLDLTGLFRPSTSLVVYCPPGTDVLVGTASGRITCQGRLGRLRATTASGSLSVEEARVVEARTVSGSIEAGGITDLARIQTRSGNIQLGSAAIAELATVSGRIIAGRVDADARVQTASGRVTMSTSGRADVRARTISGQVTVILPPGTRPDARLTSVRGRTSCNCEPGGDCRIICQSVSGKIEVATA